MKQKAPPPKIKIWRQQTLQSEENEKNYFKIWTKHVSELEHKPEFNVTSCYVHHTEVDDQKIFLRKKEDECLQFEETVNPQIQASQRSKMK